MRKFIKILKEKWLRETSLTILLVAIILMLFILINVFVKKLDVAPLDFTKEKIYSLSDDSKEEISKVDQNVTIYYFGYADSEAAVILGKQYHDVNDKITIQMVSASERPDLASEYGISSNDKIIAVQSSQRYKALSSNDLYTYDTTTYQTIDITEQKITNAILDVTIVKKPQIYFLTGNDEYSISSGSACYYLSKYIANEVNDVNTLDLLTSDMPETCDLLIICNPQKDFTDVETDKIQTYINNGGNILWLQDPYVNIKNYNKDNFPNTTKLLSQFGINFSYGVVCEESTDNMISGYPDLIIPNLNYNEIVKDIYTDGKIVMADAGKITTLSTEELEKINVTAESFIETSQKAYYKEDFTTSIEKKDSDEQGKFTLGEILTKKIDDNKSSKLVAISNAYFVTDYKITLGSSYTTPLNLRNNKDLLLNTVAYLTDREDTIRIRKDTGVVTFDTATKKQDNIVKIIIFSIPLLIILAGIIVSISRKHKGNKLNKKDSDIDDIVEIEKERIKEEKRNKKKENKK